MAAESEMRSSSPRGGHHAVHEQSLTLTSPWSRQSPDAIGFARTYANVDALRADDRIDAVTLVPGIARTRGLRPRFDVRPQVGEVVERVAKVARPSAKDASEQVAQRGCLAVETLCWRDPLLIGQAFQRP